MFPSSPIKCGLLTLSLCALMHTACAASLALPALFGDNAVLQAGAPVRVFGKAAPGETVTASFLRNGQSVLRKGSATAGADGAWEVTWDAMPAGSQGTVRIETRSGESRSIKNVLTGEVWLCAGQSNMEFILGNLKSPEARALYARQAAASGGKIRCFKVKYATSQTPIPVEGKWVVIDPDNARWFTAVGWNFAVALLEKTGRPVGLISSNWGDSAIETWIAKDDFQPESVAEKAFQYHAQEMEKGRKIEPDYAQKLEAFNQATDNGKNVAADSPQKPYPPYSLLPKRHPALAYNAMIDGLTPYTLAGVLWYQGENNSNRPEPYADLVRALINGWRKRFQNENLPFYYVELANYKSPQSKPSEDGLALIREAQAGALALPHTGVATAVDVGDADDIHPQDKRTVGLRLAGLALNDIYGMPSPCRSPQYDGYVIEGDCVRIRLKDADGLHARAQPITGFAVGDGQGRWFWADDVRIASDGTLRVRSSQVNAPTAVRYAWASNPKISLENAAGLPLRPFRTDAPAH